jgi:ribosomal protein S12 methylthiotransferase accessory factor YcaO
MTAATPANEQAVTEAVQNRLEKEADKRWDALR